VKKRGLTGAWWRGGGREENFFKNIFIFFIFGVLIC
jgi:hypothetical protein